MTEEVGKRLGALIHERDVSNADDETLGGRPEGRGKAEDADEEERVAENGSEVWL
jgi:hypothetical protein